MTCAAGGNTKRSCHFSGLCPRELWALGSLDPHRRGKSQSKESVLVNDRAVASRSMGEEAVPLENGEIRAKGADEWQNLRTCYSPKDFTNTHLGLLLHLLAPHSAASRVDYDCGGDDDDNTPSGLRNPSRRRFTPNFACFLNRVLCEEHFSPLTKSSTLSRKYRVARGRSTAKGGTQTRHRREPGTAPGGVGTDFPFLEWAVTGTEQLRKDVGGEVKKRLQASMSRPIRNEVVIAANVEENGEEFEAGQRSRGTLGKTGGVKSNCKAPETRGWSVAHSQLYLTLTHPDLKAAAPMKTLTLLSRGTLMLLESTISEESDRTHLYSRCGRNATISGELTLGHATSKGDNEHGERCERIRETGNIHSCWKGLGYKFANHPKGQRLKLKMGSQYRECVNDEGTPSVLIKGLHKGNDDVDSEGKGPGGWGSEKRRVAKPYTGM
ncbi:hypothetical protein EDB92DRAFT_1815576 [Lactarius akahatsu]|uniref:Uncharacterized protein n=1 Tax=Lactarius akahatsu TaxID=416441 RepID=A0AAD4LHP3_9AGAM|nr:hypothetical protein EDB92DRAFT_1815576 [Lactarius akahatsu]